MTGYCRFLKIQINSNDCYNCIFEPILNRKCESFIKDYIWTEKDEIEVKETYKKMFPRG